MSASVSCEKSGGAEGKSNPWAFRWVADSPNQSCPCSEMVELPGIEPVTVGPKSPSGTIRNPGKTRRLLQKWRGLRSFAHTSFSTDKWRR